MPPDINHLFVSLNNIYDLKKIFFFETFCDFLRFYYTEYYNIL